tara:strand:+ start:462 stop:1112 length:651 start_codon:yes stop_codon:yes gene_type:complete
MFKKILIVILILLFIGVLSIQFTVNTELSEVEEESEEESEEVEGFSFDNNHITEGIRMRGINRAIKKAEKEEKQKKIEADRKKREADRKKREEQEKAKRESSRRKPQVSSNSFIKLQGKVKKLDHAVYDLKNEIKSKNTLLENKLDNTVQKNELDNKIKLHQQENKKALENSEKNQDDKLKSIYLDNKVDKLEDKKRDSAHVKAINDDFRKYSGAF